MGQLWDIWEQHIATHPSPPSERAFAHDIGMTSSAFSNWQRPLSRLPNHDNLGRFAALTNVPWTRVLDAALHDAGYLPGPRIGSSDGELRIVFTAGAGSGKTEAFLMPILAELGSLAPPRARGKGQVVKVDRAGQDLLNELDDSYAAARIVIGREIVRERREAGAQPIDGEEEFWGIANVLAHTGIKGSDRDVIIERGSQLLDELLEELHKPAPHLAAVKSVFGDTLVDLDEDDPALAARRTTTPSEGQQRRAAADAAGEHPDPEGPEHGA